MNKEGARLLRKSLYILLAITLCSCTGLYAEAKYQMFSSFIVSDMNEQDKENYIENVPSETAYSEFITNINITASDTIKILGIDGEEVTKGNVGTGFKLRKTTSGQTSEFIIVIAGDSTGDGIINSADLLKIRQHLLEFITLKDEYFKASDITKDNIINSADLLKVRQHLLGMLEIK